jgi:hypothetical protein
MSDEAMLREMALANGEKVVPYDEYAKVKYMLESN